MDRNKIQHDPRNLGVPSGASKTISDPMVQLCKPCNYLAPMLVPPPNGPKQDSTRPTSPRSSIECVQNDFLSLLYVRPQPSTHLASRLASSRNARIELPLEPLHLRVASGASKTISDPTIHLVQTVHLSCTDASTTSKRTKTRFHMTTSPRSSIECVQNNFLSLWYVRHQPCTHLASRLASSPNTRNELRLEPLHLGVPSGASKMISDPMVHMVQTVHLSCTDTNTVSKQTKTRFHLTHVT